MKYIPVKDDSNIVRDPKSNAILNVNRSAFEAHKKGRERQRQLSNDVETLKDEMGEIKTLLSNILEKLK